jgi:hypothetical protein
VLFLILRFQPAAELLWVSVFLHPGEFMVQEHIRTGG